MSQVSTQHHNSNSLHKYPESAMSGYFGPLAWRSPVNYGMSYCSQAAVPKLPHMNIDDLPRILTYRWLGFYGLPRGLTESDEMLWGRSCPSIFGLGGLPRGLTESDEMLWGRSCPSIFGLGPFFVTVGPIHNQNIRLHYTIIGSILFYSTRFS